MKTGLTQVYSNDGRAKARMKYFPSANICVALCVHGDISGGSSTEGEVETEEKGNLPFFLSPLPSSLSFVSTRFHVDISALHFSNCASVHLTSLVGNQV